MDNVPIIGLDISKRSFQVHGATADGAPVLRRKLSRGKVLEFLAAQPPCLVHLRDSAGLSDARILHHYLDEQIVSGSMAQASASFVKCSVDLAVARFRPRGIRLYMAGPAAFAVVLGHRWNAVPPTRLHEFLRAGSRYVETTTI